MSSKALVLIDLQKEWTDKSSDYYVGDISQVIHNTNVLIDFCRQHDYKIIFTTHIEKESTKEFVDGSQNVELIDELHKKDFDVIVSKNKISPFFLTSLEQELRGISEVVVGGILTNLCVRSFIQDAYDRDFTITVVKDCCAAFDDETQAFTFKDLKVTREEVQFLDLNDFIQLK